MFRRNGFLFNTEGTAAPSGAQPVAAAALVVTAPVAAAATTPDGAVDPAWLSARLAREREQGRKAALGELGVTDPAVAKQVLADANAAAEAKKTAEQKLLETGGKVTTLEQENIRLREATATYATAQMASLSADQQSAVRALVPDTDPAGQLKTITALAPTWKTVAAAATPAAVPGAAATPAATPNAAATPAVATPPASTAPAVGSPPPATGSPPDHKAEYARLKATNPIAAGAYMNEHADKIYPRA